MFPEPPFYARAICAALDMGALARGPPRAPQRHILDVLPNSFHRHG